MQSCACLGPDDGDCEKEGENPDGGDDFPAVAECAEGAGVVGVDDDHKALQCYRGQVQYGGRGGQHSAHHQECRKFLENILSFSCSSVQNCVLQN